MEEKRVEFKDCYRHSLAHILAKSVVEIYGADKVKLAIGPQIEDGFYYDFLLETNISENDFEQIEFKMKEILKRKETFVRKEVSREEALELFKDQPLKIELINDLPENEVISVYYTGEDFYDLCKGPHVSNSQELLSCAFKIRSCSSAHWKGDSQITLQRIYVSAFSNKQELKEYLQFLKEARERDHRKLGPQLDLFFIDDTAPGMPYWLPKGWKLFNLMLEFWREEHEKRGYQEISSPLINHNSMWITSGHWAHYKDNMFVIPVDENTTYGVKPMNCPNSILVYKRKVRSYKELPLRFSDCDVLHRNEKSGSLNGLLRVQMFRQDDSHNFITEEQIFDEVNNILDIADRFYGIFGLTYRPELSTRPADFMGDIELWDKAERALKEILNNRYGEDGYDVNEGDGAFYGPKIDIMMKDALKRQWQMGTIQLDFQLPRSFDIHYIDNEGNHKTPVIIHRVIYGSFERFIGILIEHFKGIFPYWLSPVQVGIITIRKEHEEYAKKIENLLSKHKIRFEKNYDEIHLNNKIKLFKNEKVPYIIIVGDQEVNSNTISLNTRTGKNISNIKIEDFIKVSNSMNEEKVLNIIDML